MLTVHDPLPALPRRIAVAGVSGVGKTTLAGRIATTIDVPHVEIDALFHGPGWVPRESFVDDVRSFVARDAWVTEWQYSAVRALILDRIDLLVWLDLPYWRVALPRVVRRTVSRRVRRTVLWGVNIEPPLHTVFTDREHIVRWSVSHRHAYVQRMPVVIAEHPQLPIVRLRSQHDVDAWLRGPLAASGC